MSVPSSPWNNWYHAIGSTYGVWLPGDPRGFRTRHHDEHVEGDYKKPPPAGIYEEKFAHSKRLSKHPPTKLTPEQRAVVCRALGERLVALNVEVVELCVGMTHFHLLARFTPLKSPGTVVPGLCPQNALQDGRDPVPRHLLGLAKKHAAFILRRTPGAPPRLWAVRSRILPIEDRAHQLRTARYLRAHAASGAMLWSNIKPPT